MDGWGGGRGATLGCFPMSSVRRGWRGRGAALDSTEMESVEGEPNQLGQSQNFVFGETGSEQLADSVKVSRERGRAGVPDARPAMPTVLFCSLFKFFLSQNELRMRRDDD